MILKQKALAIFDFLAAPTEKLYERAARFHLKSLAEVLEGKATYQGERIYALSTFPEIAAALGPKALENAALATAVKAEPLAALQLLLAHPQLASTLEPAVLSSGEATYYWLKALRDKKAPLAPDKAATTSALLKDPFWAIRTWGDTQDDALLAAVLQMAKADKDKTVAGAYVHLYFTPDADPADFVEILSSSPMYAYLASRHFYDRGIEFKYFNLRGLTPRWAYHFITDGFLDDEEGLIDTMLSSPDWLIEYIVESERYKDLAYTKTIVEKIEAKAAGNLQITYLKMWWERVQEHVKKLPPPKPPVPPAAKSS